MTATNAASRNRATTPLPDTLRLGAGRLVRSEWIKLRSIRSTWWCSAVLVAVTIGTAVLVGAGSGSGSGIPQDLVNGLGVAKNTTAVPLAALIVGVLGVLIISGEYGTGQIRSTFVAAPRRTGVVFAKAAVLPLVGASVYLTMIALLAFSIGLLVRSSAGGIAVTLGLLLVLPVVLALVGDVLRAQWVADVSQFLPSAAGGQLYHYDFADASGQQGIVLDGWTGFAVLLAEVLVVGALALTVARRRDV